jgi:preprotein translocase SecE subunit
VLSEESACHRCLKRLVNPGKEACLLSQQDTEKKSEVITAKRVWMFQGIRDFPEFLKKVRLEMKLVDTPTWRQVRSTTAIVIAFVFLFAFYLRMLDWIFTPLNRWIFNH